MNKQPQRTAATRNILISTFLSLNEQKPMEKITISELTRKAGYNRSTFYQYFNDTYHLLSYIEDEFLAYIHETIVGQIGKEKSAALFIEQFIHIFSEKRRLLKLLLNSSNFHTKLKDFLIPAFAARLGLPLAEEKNVFLLEFYLSGIISILARWVSSETPMPPEEYALLMRRIVEGMKKSELFPVI